MHPLRPGELAGLDDLRCEAGLLGLRPAVEAGGEAAHDVFRHALPRRLLGQVIQEDPPRLVRPHVPQVGQRFGFGPSAALQDGPELRDHAEHPQRLLHHVVRGEADALLGVDRNGRHAALLHRCGHLPDRPRDVAVPGLEVLAEDEGEDRLHAIQAVQRRVRHFELVQVAQEPVHGLPALEVPGHDVLRPEDHALALFRRVVEAQGVEILPEPFVDLRRGVTRVAYPLVLRGRPRDVQVDDRDEYLLRALGPQEIPARLEVGVEEG